MSDAADNLVLTPLMRLWLPAVLDHLTTTDPTENPPGGIGEGQLFYVPAQRSEGTHALYRLYDVSSRDHMDSLVPNEGGYALESVLGYPFDDQLPGTEPIRRWFHPTHGDHLLAFTDEDPGPHGYVAEGVLGYGYPRFGTRVEVPITVQGAEVTLTANRAAGGAISELWWNGQQFVNNWDYGRQIQIAFNLRNQGETDNPTEAGDYYGCPGVVAGSLAHGSPLLDWNVAGTQLTTECHPLQWRPETFGGGADAPVLWQGTIAKQIDLDWQGNPHVIRWGTTITFPSDEAYLDLEVATAYLTTEFSRFYAFNAATGDVYEIPMEMWKILDPSQDSRLCQAAGGVMLATDDGAYALGIYRRAPEHGVNACGLCSFIEADGGKYGPGAAKWNLLFRPPWGESAGPHSFVVYLLVGTRDQVLEEAQALYQDGS